MMKFLIYLNLLIGVFWVFFNTIPGLGLLDELLTLISVIILLIIPAKFRQDLPYNRLFILFIIMVFLSALSNPIQLNSSILAIIGYAKPIIFLNLVATFLRNEQDMKKMIYFILFISLIQVPIIIVQVAENFGNPDVGTGLLGNAQYAGIILALPTLVYIYRAYYTRSWNYLLIVVLILITIILTDTKQIYFILPGVAFILIYMSKKTRKINLRLFLYFSFIFSVVIFSANKLMPSYFRSGGLTYLGPRILLTEKFNGYYQLFYDLPDDINSRYIGAGPGNYASGAAIKYKTPLSYKYIGYYIDITKEGEGGTMNSRSSGIIGLIGEIGWIGFFLYILAYLKIGRTLWRHSSIETNPFWASVIFAGAGFCYIILILSIFRDSFTEIIYVYPFMVLVAIQRNREEQLLKIR